MERVQPASQRGLGPGTLLGHLKAQGHGLALSHFPGNAHVRAKSLQSCPTLCDPMDCSPPGSSVHGILQARILDWAAILSSRGSSRPRDQAQVSYISCVGRRVLYHECHLGSRAPGLGDELGLPHAWPAVYLLWGVHHTGPSPSTNSTSVPSAAERRQTASRSLVALGAAEGDSGFPGLHSQSTRPP